MPSSTDLKLFSADTQDDSATNGGRPDPTNQVVSDTLGELLPRPSIQERESTGWDRYRKFFPMNDAADDGPVSSPYLMLWGPGLPDGSPTDDEIYIFEGTHDDRQSDIASPQLAGMGFLDVGVAAGATSIDVRVKDPAKAPFAVGQVIRIHDASTYTQLATGTGYTEEDRTISGVSTPGGDIVRLTIDATENTWAADTTRITVKFSMAETMQATIASVTPTVAGDGALDDTACTAHNQGGVYETITLDWTSADDYTVSGDTLGALGTGSRLSDLTIQHPSTTDNILTIPAAAWSGTHANGDSYAIQIHPATGGRGYWIRHVGPAGASPASWTLGIIIGGDNA